MIAKLREGFSTLENNYFKAKVELETIKLDKKYYEEKLALLENQLADLSLEKRDIEKRYME